MSGALRVTRVRRVIHRDTVPGRDGRRVRDYYSGLMATVRQVQVTFDCANPRAVAEFLEWDAHTYDAAVAA
jgi:hypothetical protein